MQRLSRESDGEGGDRVAMALPAEEVAALGPAEAYWGGERGELVFRGRGVRLTPREREVLRLVGEGRTNPEIADILVISPRTVAYHVSNLLGKPCLASRVALAQLTMLIRQQPGDL